jgi:hypothetical protein
VAYRTLKWFNSAHIFRGIEKLVWNSLALKPVFASTLSAGGIAAEMGCRERGL